MMTVIACFLFLFEKDGCQGGIATPSWYGCRAPPASGPGSFSMLSSARPPPTIDSSCERAGRGRTRETGRKGLGLLGRQNVPTSSHGLPQGPSGMSTIDAMFSHAGAMILQDVSLYQYDIRKLRMLVLLSHEVDARPLEILEILSCLVLSCLVLSCLLLSVCYCLT